MPPRIIPPYNKKHYLYPDSVEHDIESIKKGLIKRITSNPAVSMRGHREDVIKFNNDKEPRLIWNLSILENLSESALRELAVFVEKRSERQ